jgi:hypothetical protein
VAFGGVREVPATEHRAAINRKGAPHRDQGGGHAVAPPKELDTGRFGAPCASYAARTRGS